MTFKILRTESKSDYDKLQAEFVECLNPTNVIERRYVDEIVQYTWEMMRYQRVATGIHNSALRRALAQILHEILLPPSTATMTNKSLISAQHISYWWTIDPQGNRQVASLLKEAGRDVSEVEGRAHVLEADNIAHANRMFRSAQEGRDNTLRSMAKYRKRWAVQARQNSDRVLAADQAARIADGEED